MIEGLFNSDGIDVLERTMQFAHGRHRLIVNNIANLSTPNFRPTDVDPGEFHRALKQAIEERDDRSKGGGRGKSLDLRDTNQLKFRNGRIELEPEPTGDHLLFHDRNDRDLERIMQSLAENTLVHRTAAELMRSKFALLQSAIRERI